jgi:mono/diheme cytochrome c family protein
MAIFPSARAARSARLTRAWLGVLVTAATLTGCSEPSSPGGPSAERGRQLYLSQCIACHNSDPAKAGPLGPPIKGSPRELLEAKVLRGAYPPGYAPKRPTTVMPPQPALAGEIENLTAFLKP